MKMIVLAIVPKMFASITLPDMSDIYSVVAFMKKIGYLAPDYAVPTGAVAIMFLLWAAMVLAMLYKWLK